MIRLAAGLVCAQAASARNNIADHRNERRAEWNIETNSPFLIGFATKEAIPSNVIHTSGTLSSLAAYPALMRPGGIIAVYLCPHFNFVLRTSKKVFSIRSNFTA